MRADWQSLQLRKKQRRKVVSASFRLVILRRRKHLEDKSDTMAKCHRIFHPIAAVRWKKS